MFETFSSQARVSLTVARGEATRGGSGAVRPAHILLGVTGMLGTKARWVLEYLRVDLPRLREKVAAAIIPDGRAEMSGQITLSSSSSRLFERAESAAENLGGDSVDTQHLLYALVDEEEGGLTSILGSHGISRASVVDSLLAMPPGPSTAPERDARSRVSGLVLLDRLTLRTTLGPILQQGRSVALEGPVGVGKTFLLYGMANIRAYSLGYFPFEMKALDEHSGQALLRAERPGTVCFLSRAELLTNSCLPVERALLARQAGGERFVLEFRPGGTDEFAIRFPEFSRDLARVNVPVPDPDEAGGLLSTALKDLRAIFGLEVGPEAVSRAASIAEGHLPAPWGTIRLLENAVRAHREFVGGREEASFPRLLQSLDPANRDLVQKLRQAIQTTSYWGAPLALEALPVAAKALELEGHGKRG